MDWRRYPVSTHSNFNPFVLVAGLLLSLCVSHALWCTGFWLKSALTGSYVRGQHSVLLINSPDRVIAKVIGRNIMEKRLAASINIHDKIFVSRGEIQESSEVLMWVKTKTSKVQQIIDFVRSIHPYANPEILSFLVDNGNMEFTSWLEEDIPK